MSNLLQVSVDGPSVNCSLLEKLIPVTMVDSIRLCFSLVLVVFTLLMVHLKQVMQQESGKSCCCYVHFTNVLKTSVGEYYIDWTGSELFPRKSCLIRWFENVDICQKALNVFGNMKKYISIAKKLPATFAVRIVREVSSDELCLPRLRSSVQQHLFLSYSFLDFKPLHQLTISVCRGF